MKTVCALVQGKELGIFECIELILAHTIGGFDHDFAGDDIGFDLIQFGANLFGDEFLIVFILGQTDAVFRNARCV